MRWAFLLFMMTTVALARAEPAPAAAVSASAPVSPIESSAPIPRVQPPEPPPSSSAELGTPADPPSEPAAPIRSSVPPPVAPEPAAPAPPAPLALPAPLAPPIGSAPPPTLVRDGPPPASSAPEPRLRPGVPVRLGDSTVFVLRAPRAGKPVEERARLAAAALNAAVDDPRAAEVRLVRQGDVVVVYAGPVPLIQLSEDDSMLAGDSSLEVHAAGVATAVRQALASERQRSRVAKNVFSGSLVVFFALIAFYLVRKLAELTERAREWLDAHGDRVLAVRVQRVELVGPAMMKNASLIALSIAKWLGGAGILYAWLVLVLSLFEGTKGYRERLTGFAVSPFSELMARLARALPLAIVGLIAALAVFVLVRFVALFFASVARRETTLSWLPPDLAAPTSVLLRLGIVVTALIFAGPIVTGNADGAFSRTGLIVLVALGLASTPLLASALVGSVVLFGRRLRVGEHAELAGTIGRIVSINLLELRLLLADRTELRVPHLLLLRGTLKGLGRLPRLTVELAVSAAVPPSTVLRLLDQAAGRVGRDVYIEVLAADADGVLYRITATCESLDQRSALTVGLVDALSAASIPLGHLGRAPRPA